jgi:hypothetical protein
MTTTSLRSAASVQSQPRSLNPFQNSYTTTLFVLTVALLTVFPICSYAVFGLGTDRTATSNGLSFAYCIIMTGLLVAPWLPFSALEGDTTYRRLERMMYIWIIVFSLTAVLWEIPWLLLWERIATAQDELWAYTWWAYIDGGDFRYVHPDWMVFYIEGWTDFNGVLSLIALTAWLRSGKTKVLPIYYFMFVAAVHIVNTLLYLVSEIATGFPHVEVNSFVNLYVKFFWSNGFWLVMPFLVLVWGKLTLERVYRERYSAASP